jgi:hypothetical protein
MWPVLFSMILLATVAFADDAESRATLVGSWQPDSATDGSWNLETRGADMLRVTYAVANQKPTQFECTTTGKECQIKDSGKSAKVSMWFNGGKLVALETRGDEVVKRRFTVGEKGDTLEIEVFPITPSGATQTLHFKRAHSEQASTTK